MPLPQERRIRLAAIGHWIAKSQIKQQGSQPLVTLIEPADNDEFHTPAQSVQIYGKAAVIELRDFLDSVLDDLHEDSKPEVKA